MGATRGVCLLLSLSFSIPLFCHMHGLAKKAWMWAAPVISFLQTPQVSHGTTDECIGSERRERERERE